MTNRFFTQRGVLLVIAVSFLSSVGLEAAGPLPKTSRDQSNPAVMPLNSNPLDVPYEQWAARWWQWEFSMAVTANPIFDTAGCGAGQTGRVWFLGGGSVVPAPGVLEVRRTRICPVPASTFLFLPIVNTECSTAPGDNNGHTSTDELRNCAIGARSTINYSTLSATLDGVAINNLAQYTVTSPQFTYGPLPANNVLQFFGLDGAPGASYQSVTDGIYLMLHPLAAGTHTLHFFCQQDFGGGSGFIQDITYYLAVTP